MSDSIFFDLQKEITSNPEFINKVQKVMHSMQLASKEGKDEEFRHHMHELLRLCDYNASLLVPYFFPKFPDDKPMTLWERPHAISMMSFIPNGTLTVQASRQIGKCLDADTKLVTKVAGEEKQLTIAELFIIGKENGRKKEKSVS